MRKYCFVIDVAKCLDCNNCYIACKDEHEENAWPGYALPQPRHEQRWIDVVRTERGSFPLIDVAYRPTPCMHCEDGPCQKTPGGAVTRRRDGIVLIDPGKARGGKDLAKACPYGAIQWNEEEQTPQKCTLCAHLLDEGWDQTRCTQACFTGALRLFKLEDQELAQMIRDEGLETLHPERGTRPRTYYKNLYRFNKSFIAGSVAIQKDSVMECVKGSVVSLFKEGDKLGEALSDAFGDFRFDRLDKNSGVYSVVAEFQGRRTEPVTVDLAESRNLGVLQLCDPDR